MAWTASVGRDLIRGVVNRNKPEVRQCFREGMVRDPLLAGEVEVAFTIQGDGSVAYPTIARSTVNDYFRRWDWDGTLVRIHHALYVRCREAVGREASPTAAIIDSQSVKSAEKGGARLIRRGMIPARRSRARSGTCW